MFTVPYKLPSYVFGPKWFHGIDTILELFAIITCILLLYYSYKCYKFTSEKRYWYFSTAFLSITLAFLARILGTLAIYSQRVRTSAVAKVVDANFTRVTIFSVNSIAFIAYIFFMILGLMILFLIVSELSWKNKRVLTMLSYFVFVAAWLGIIHIQLFYLTTLVM